LLSTHNWIHCPVSSGISVQFKSELVSSILWILQILRVASCTR